MDTENFILNRRQMIERLEARRAKDLSDYPFRMAADYGVKLPPWARWALSFASRGGALSKVLEIGLPLAIPLIFKTKVPFLNRVIGRVFSPKA